MLSRRNNQATHRLPTHEEITERAYLLYLEGGCQPGHDVDDWLQAEYELMQLPIRKIAELEPPKPRKGILRTKSLIAVVQAALWLGSAGLAQFGRR